MATITERCEAIANKVHSVLSDALAADEERQIDDFDAAVLKLAAQSIALMLILEGRMKVLGVLKPEQAEVYIAAAGRRRTLLHVLGIDDPYVGPAS